MVLAFIVPKYFPGQSSLYILYEISQFTGTMSSKMEVIVLNVITLNVTPKFQML